MLAQARSDNLLRKTFLANVTISTLTGALLVLDAAPLAQFMGLPSPWPLVAVGLVTVAFAFIVWQIARAYPIDLTRARVIAWLDVAWVVASYALLLLPGLPLTTEGRWAIGLVAEVVFVLAVLEFIGLRRAQR
jgi:hypothetical protein